MARTLKVADNGVGHNSQSGVLDSEKLRKIVAQGVGIRQEQRELSEELKEICAAGEEATGVSKSELRALIALAMKGLERGQEVVDAKRSRMDDLLAALGPFADLPLGQAATAAANRQTDIEDAINAQ